jgi:hypothetical protein
MRDGYDPLGAKCERNGGAGPGLPLREGKRSYRLRDAAKSMFEGVITKD